MISLNGGYAMIKYNSTQEELQIAYRSKKPVLCYDENRRAHWAVIEETATERVDEETQEPITIYEYSYRLIDEASGGKLYEHSIKIIGTASTQNDRILFLKMLSKSNTPKTWEEILSYCSNEQQATGMVFASGETHSIYSAITSTTRLMVNYGNSLFAFLANPTSITDTISEV